MTGAALISPCGQYRYHLSRVWDAARLRVCYIMLNPSTADANKDDATIRRCIGYAQRWEVCKGVPFGGIDVVNLYAYRATNPTALKLVADPIGPDNDLWLKRVCSSEEVGMIVAAWGAHAQPGRVQQVVNMLPYTIYQIGQY